MAHYCFYTIYTIHCDCVGKKRHRRNIYHNATRTDRSSYVHYCCCFRDQGWLNCRRGTVDKMDYKENPKTVIGKNNPRSEMERGRIS